jgi:hypothetical protein
LFIEKSSNSIFLLVSKVSSYATSFTINSPKKSKKISVFDVTNAVRCYDSQDLKALPKIASRGSASIYNSYWKGTTRFAIKKFEKNKISMKKIVNEVRYRY